MQQPVYDAIIVGSGAGGGMAAKVLTDAGLSVAILEAGGDYDPAKDEYRTQLRWPWESPRRGGGTSRRPFGDFDAAWGGWELEGEPYTRGSGTKFDWFRSRMVGGRTNHWGRISLRFGPKDFKRRDHDGLSDNWPIGYDDVKPYYDRVDKLIGVFGTNEGLPNDPDGFFLPPPKPRLHELYFMRGAAKVGVPVYPSRLSILTRRVNEERGACFFCAQCNRGCSVYGDFSSSSVLIKPARGSGKAELFTNAMVRAVVTDANGKATGVSYINKVDRREYQLRGKVVLLGASACESARILLNSASNTHRNGIGNQGGHVGRYLHDSTGADRSGILPSLIGRDRYNEDGVGGMHIYTPWWLDGKNLDFPRGYHLEYWGGFGMPGYGMGMSLDTMRQYVTDQFGAPGRNGGYGAGIKRDIRALHGASLGLSGRGESIPQYTNYCELDPNVVDQYGIPVLRFHYQWTDHERRQAKHMHDTFEEILTAAGATLLGTKPGPENEYGLAAPGRIIHEVGTTRMGDDPNTSVTDRFGRTHDCDNVYVVDAGTFVSQADKNPTWTILALAWRAADHVVDRFKTGELR
jgi:choline dehydrogenase-like flavoprotein